MTQADENEHRQAVDRLCQRLGIEADLPHLPVALTHPSYANEQPDAVAHNQRLEFLGDAVLGVCVSELLMEAFSDVDEGDLTVMRASMVNTKALAAVARELGVAAALRLGRGADAAGERHRANVLADAVEALVAAVYVDRGLAAARELCRSLVRPRLAELVARGRIQRDPKSRLQELLQARGLGTPSYEVVDEEGPPHARTFTVRVDAPLDGPLGADGCEEVEGGWRVRAHGTGRSKKLAEQAAARAVLALLDASDR